MTDPKEVAFGDYSNTVGNEIISVDEVGKVKEVSIIKEDWRRSGQ